MRTGTEWQLFNNLHRRVSLISLQMPSIQAGCHLFKMGSQLSWNNNFQVNTFHKDKNTCNNMFFCLAYKKSSHSELTRKILSVNLMIITIICDDKEIIINSLFTISCKLKTVKKPDFRYAKEVVLFASLKTI